MKGVELAVGSIGWEGEDEHFFLGTADNDGHTLVRVQLFSGRDISAPLNPTRAQGTKLLCHIMGGLFRIPKKDTRVYVLVPSGMEATPGAGLIIGTVEPSPTDQFTDDRAVLDFGPDVHLVIKAKSISLQDPDNRFLTVGTPRVGGTPGLLFQAADGSGGVIQEGVVSWFVASGGDAKTVLQMTASKAECMTKSGGYWTVNTSGFQAVGTSCAIQGSAVYLGKAPTAANMCLWGPTGIAGVGSTSVFISPA